MEVYAVDPASVANGHLAAYLALTLTFAACAGIVALLGERGWWLAAIAVLVLPTLATYPFGGRPEWSVAYLPDVLLPLALVLGMPSGAAGAIVGALVRRWRGRRTSKVR